MRRTHKDNANVSMQLLKKVGLASFHFITCHALARVRPQPGKAFRHCSVIMIRLSVSCHDMVLFLVLFCFIFIYQLCITSAPFHVETMNQTSGTEKYFGRAGSFTPRVLEIPAGLSSPRPVERRNWDRFSIFRRRRWRGSCWLQGCGWEGFRSGRFLPLHVKGRLDCVRSRMYSTCMAYEKIALL